MKAINLFIFAVIIFYSNLSFSQSERGKKTNYEVGITYAALGNADIVHSGIDGAPSYESERVQIIGLNAVSTINPWLEFETGLEYGKYKFRVESYRGPGMPVNISSANAELLTIPVTVRAVFLKYFFINAGGLCGIHISNQKEPSNQSGLGLMAGLGARYAFKNGLSLMINPYMRIHNLIHFGEGRNGAYLLENGVRFGAGYRL
jgi:hypothetical protein